MADQLQGCVVLCPPSRLLWLHHRLLGDAEHDLWPPRIRGRADRLHYVRDFFPGNQPQAALRQAVRGVCPGTIEDHPVVCQEGAVTGARRAAAMMSSLAFSAIM